MALNLELKIKTDNFYTAKTHLDRIKAEYCGELNQKDVYFNVTEGLLKLRIEDGKQELIRYTRDEINKDRFSDYEILIIESPGAEDFLSKIFSVTAVVEKKRMLYMYDNTRIHLDEVKNLGFFLELETLVISSKEDAVERFNKIVELLNLDVTKQIKASYMNLIQNIKNNQPDFSG